MAICAGGAGLSQAAVPPAQHTQQIGRVQLAEGAYMNSMRRLTQREDGQDLLEYGLLAALIAIFAIGAITSVGNAVSNVLWATIAANF